MAVVPQSTLPVTAPSSCAAAEPSRVTAEEPEGRSHGGGGGDIGGESEGDAGAILPRRNSDYASREYWEGRFAREEEHEWLLPFGRLRPRIEPLLLQSSNSPSILVVGCGNSPFSADLYDAGFRDVVSVDYSEAVIAKMRRRHSGARPEMRWLVMDMTDMSGLGDGSFDVVLDKAAADSLLSDEGDVWDPRPEAVEAARSYCAHASRVLRPGGSYVQVSIAQPHFRAKYLLGRRPGRGPDGRGCLGYSHEFGWTLRVEEASSGPGSPSTFGYFVYIMTKDPPRRGRAGGSGAASS
jgi:SAM-dependent methyltransferase